MRRSFLRVLPLLLLAGCGGDGTVNNDAPQLTLTLRARPLTGPEPDQGADAPSLSADGRYVAFSSNSTTLSADDDDAFLDVFVQDLWTRTITLASRAPGAAGAGGNGHSYSPSISADGRYVAFVSAASNLHPDDTDSISDVFVRDLQTDELHLASRGTADLGIKDSMGGVLSPVISGNGCRVSFSSSSRFHPDDPDTLRDIYVRDLAAGTTLLASRATGASGAKGTGGLSGDSSISHDGTLVAFVSEASGLAPGTNTYRNIYLRDLAADTTSLISRASGAAGAGANDICHHPVVSGDGHFVLFASDATNLDPEDVDDRTNHYLRDLRNSTTRVLSRSAGPVGGPNVPFLVHEVSLSYDGSRLAFASDASNLIRHDENFRVDIFVWDLPTDVLTRVSVRTFGAESDGGSSDPCLSADGRFIAFSSQAENLVDDDGNHSTDVFIRGPLP
jgi:Tol biopolymer transport system component